MRTSAYYLLALVALAAARPQYSPPYTSSSSLTSDGAWSRPEKGSYQPYSASCTGYDDDGCSPAGSPTHRNKHKHPEHGPSTASEAGPTGSAFPTYGSANGGYSGSGTGAGEYQQPTTTPSYGGGGDNPQPTSVSSYRAVNYSGNIATSGNQQVASASPYGGGGGGASGSPTAGGGSGNPSGTSIARPAQSSAGLLNTSGNATIGNGKVTLPAGCESKNGIGIGWLPDSESGSSLTTIVSALGGVKPCWAGYYAHITSSTWDGSELTSQVAQVKAGGAPYPIMIASVQPYIDFSAVPAMASQFTTVMNELTSQGLTVWLRFAHEMNYYDSSAAGYQYKGTSQEFSTAWGAVSDAVKANPNVLMFWSPNAATASQLQSAGWYPSSGDIDVIGIDVYSKGATQTFADAYGDFCNGFGNIPFVIGETGSDSASADKTNWLQQLTSTEAKTTCPNYLGFSWFEYNKEGVEYRVATGGNTEAQSVLGTSS